ncbi:DUF4168 domain-containing protein [Achromobacter denitrificans]|jgi:hypothetical protein|uniref:DUF4168 domain-containing protein n=1 Tax=Achromobacter denitrificans TaxID=32002 RepID=A0A427WMS9_ACHDE|nr:MULTISPECIES: DUF4168 domain-containing protein [Achromobacter]ASC66779.1 hypothetical protein B9P52_21975 [Achromobacter denitrificans]MBV2161378.1 DUF4168 domain-containing protein [Achromobacter denitrificans]MDF3852485.1 DUF4168 domain-containing protein [Achromobacter denitrificans]MDF3861970.1 DUF4168 domain-containing protein [Achromobacter denitrificans]MDF3938714.1 DUF4168 domain-containing protein [Achromobacter denitrificans]
MQRSTYAFLSAAVLTTALSGAPAFAQAAGQAQAQAQAQQQMAPPPAMQPTDQQLQRYAAASQKISGVVDEYRPKVDAAKTDEAKQKVVQEADAKMVQLVRADGLSVEEFNGIGQAVQQDPQLKQRVMNMSKGGLAPQ